jgi:hypothetical protein
MSAVAISHRETGLDRVACQYENSTKFLAHLTALLEQHDELEAVYQKISEQLDIDLAEGVNLDVVGDIVGVGRILPNSIPMQFFGFDGQPVAAGFGEEGFLGVGARFRDELESEAATSVLADIEFRMLIRAKIVKNHSHGTNEDMLASLAFLFNTPRVIVDDPGGMTINVAIGRQLTWQEKYIVKSLNVLPKAGGVRIGSYVTYAAANYFGFDGQPGSLSFGEEGQPLIGGLLAEEF